MLKWLVLVWIKAGPPTDGPCVPLRQNSLNSAMVPKRVS